MSTKEIDISELTDVSELDSIETSFKVFAGPGAGKTTWLAERMERVLLETKRLNKTSKIACITYTNVAVDQLYEKLKGDKSRYDISTIHSFLYRNVVKPFSFLIEKDDNGDLLFDVSKLNGHEEHFPLRNNVQSWINDEKNRGVNYSYLLYNNKFEVIAKCLSALDWRFSDNSLEQLEHCFFRQSTNFLASEIRMPTTKLYSYKRKCWEKGYLYHEDVLYFSHYIISRYPKVLGFIRQKYPYIFVDEFQDTTEIQTWILEKIAEKDVTIGVVGDMAQSIYKFAGAKRDDFISFKRNELTSYKLDKNYRSTHKIVDFLNLLRPDIKQQYGSKKKGSDTVLLVGEINKVIEWYGNTKPLSELYIITRNNNDVELIKERNLSKGPQLLSEMYNCDSNSKRARLIHSMLECIKYHDKLRFKDSLGVVLKQIRRRSKTKAKSNLEMRRIGLAISNYITTNENRAKTIKDVYNEINIKLSSDYHFTIEAKLTRGKGAEYYSKYSFNDIIPEVKIDAKTEDLVRTIHSTKGTEFNNVLIHFDKKEYFEKYILSSHNHINAESDDCRIYYVGCSRAMEKLYLNIPDLDGIDSHRLSEMGFDIENLNLIENLIANLKY